MGRDKDYKRNKTCEKGRNERHVRDTRKNEKRSNSRRHSSKQDVIQLSDGSFSDGGVEIVSDEEDLDIDIDEDSDEEAIIERRRQKRKEMLYRLQREEKGDILNTQKREPEKKPEPVIKFATISAGATDYNYDDEDEDDDGE